MERHRGSDSKSLCVPPSTAQTNEEPFTSVETLSMLEWTEGRLVSPPGNQRGRNTDFYTLESKYNAGKMRLQPWHPQSGKMEWPEMAAPRQV